MLYNRRFYFVIEGYNVARIVLFFLSGHAPGRSKPGDESPAALECAPEPTQH